MRLNLLAIPAGFEPATLCLEGRCSIQLSYGIIGALPHNLEFGKCSVGAMQHKDPKNR